jgi:hypothetical protein
VDAFTINPTKVPAATQGSRIAHKQSETLYTCPYAKAKKLLAQKKAEAGMLGVSEAKAGAKAAGTQHRTGVTSRGLSIKSCKCEYKCRLVVYDHLPEQAYVYLSTLGSTQAWG